MATAAPTTTAFNCSILRSCHIRADKLQYDAVVKRACLILLAALASCNATRLPRAQHADSSDEQADEPAPVCRDSNPQHAGRITVTLRYADGKPRTDHNVQLAFTDMAHAECETIVALTDNAGVAQFDQLLPTSYEINANDSNGPFSVTVQPGATHSGALQAQRRATRRPTPADCINAGTIDGIVQTATAGAPLANQDIMVTSQQIDATATSDAGGHFHIECIRAGMYDITLDNDRYPEVGVRAFVVANQTTNVSLRAE